MARIRDLVFDCRHPASLARFWAAALDGYAVAPYDDAELARLHAVTCADLRAETRRLTGLGAPVQAEHERWVTLADPEGNEFDVMRD